MHSWNCMRKEEECSSLCFSNTVDLSNAQVFRAAFWYRHRTRHRILSFQRPKGKVPSSFAVEKISCTDLTRFFSFHEMKQRMLQFMFL